VSLKAKERLAKVLPRAGRGGDGRHQQGTKRARSTRRMGPWLVAAGNLPETGEIGGGDLNRREERLPKVRPMYRERGRGVGQRRIFFQPRNRLSFSNGGGEAGVRHKCILQSA